MRHIGRWASIGVVLAASVAAALTLPSKPSRLPVFDTDSVSIDLGIVEGGGKVVNVVFTIYNRGSGRLSLSAPRLSCSEAANCRETVVDMPRRVAAGSWAPVEIAIVPRLLRTPRGEVAVRFETNDPQTPTAVLRAGFTVEGMGVLRLRRVAPWSYHGVEVSRSLATLSVELRGQATGVTFATFDAGKEVGAVTLEPADDGPEQGSLWISGETIPVDAASATHRYVLAARMDDGTVMFSEPAPISEAHWPAGSREMAKTVSLTPAVPLASSADVGLDSDWMERFGFFAGGAALNASAPAARTPPLRWHVIGLDEDYGLLQILDQYLLEQRWNEAEELVATLREKSYCDLPDRSCDGLQSFAAGLLHSSRALSASDGSSSAIAGLEKAVAAYERALGADPSRERLVVRNLTKVLLRLGRDGDAHEAIASLASSGRPEDLIEAAALMPPGAAASHIGAEYVESLLSRSNLSSSTYRRLADVVRRLDLESADLTDFAIVLRDRGLYNESTDVLVNALDRARVEGSSASGRRALVEWLDVLANSSWLPPALVGPTASEWPDPLARAVVSLLVGTLPEPKALRSLEGAVERHVLANVTLAVAGSHADRGDEQKAASLLSFARKVAPLWEDYRSDARLFPRRNTRAALAVQQLALEGAPGTPVSKNWRKDNILTYSAVRRDGMIEYHTASARALWEHWKQLPSDKDAADWSELHATRAIALMGRRHVEGIQGTIDSRLPLMHEILASLFLRSAKRQLAAKHAERAVEGYLDFDQLEQAAFVFQQSYGKGALPLQRELHRLRTLSQVDEETTRQLAIRDLEALSRDVAASPVFSAFVTRQLFKIFADLGIAIEGDERSLGLTSRAFYYLSRLDQLLTAADVRRARQAAQVIAAQKFEVPAAFALKEYVDRPPTRHLRSWKEELGGSVAWWTLPKDVVRAAYANL